MMSEHFFVCRSWVNKRVELRSINNTLYNSFNLDHTKIIVSINISPDNQKLFILYTDSIIVIYDLYYPSKISIDLKLDVDITNTYQVLMSHNNQFLVVYVHKHIYVYDIETGQCIKQFTEESNNMVTAISISPDGYTLAIGYRDGCIKIWDVNVDMGYKHPIFKYHVYFQLYPNIIFQMGFLPDGKTLVCHYTDGIITVWNIQNRTPSGELNQPRPGGYQTIHPTNKLSLILAILISPSGNVFAILYNDEIEIYQKTNTTYEYTHSILNEYGPAQYYKFDGFVDENTLMVEYDDNRICTIDIITKKHNTIENLIYMSEIIPTSHYHKNFDIFQTILLTKAKKRRIQYHICKEIAKYQNI